MTTTMINELYTWRKDIGIENASSNKHRLHIYKRHTTCYDDVKTMDFCDYLKVKNNSKWGIIDFWGKVIVPIEYDEIISFIPNFFITCKGEHKGVFNVKDGEIYPNEADEIYLFYQSKDFTYIEITINQKVGIIDTKGTCVVPYQYSEIHICTDKDGLLYFFAQDYDWDADDCFAPYRSDLIDLDGNLFSLKKNGYNDCFEKNSQFYLIRGTRISEPYDEIIHEYDDCFKVRRGDYWGIIDQEIVYEDIQVKSYCCRYYEEYDYRYEYKHYVKIKKNGLWGILDQVAPQYEDILWVGSKMYAIKKDCLWGIINDEGEYVLDSQYEKINFEFDSSIFFLKKDGFWGCLDIKENKVILPFKFDILHSISGGQLFVALKDFVFHKYNHEGKLIYRCNLWPGDFTRGYENEQSFQYLTDSQKIDLYTDEDYNDEEV